MEATAYCNDFRCTGKRPGDKGYGITYTGTIAGPGTVAADLSILPPGTKLFIPGYGPGVVSDTGGKIKGNKLDLWFSDHESALKWGRQLVRVEILERGNKHADDSLHANR